MIHATLWALAQDNPIATAAVSQEAQLHSLQVIGYYNAALNKLLCLYIGVCQYT